MPFCGEDNKVVQGYFLGVLGAIWAVMYGGYFPFMFMMGNAEADLFYDNYYLLVVNAIIGGLIAVFMGPLCFLQKNKDTTIVLKGIWFFFQALLLFSDTYLESLVFDIYNDLKCNLKFLHFQLNFHVFGGRIGMHWMHLFLLALFIKSGKKIEKSKI